MEEKPDGFSQIGSAISGFFAVIARFFAEFATAMAKGDLFVKLTLVWWGAGYLRRKQYVKALLMTLLEAAVILFTVTPTSPSSAAAACLSPFPFPSCS